MTTEPHTFTVEVTAIPHRPHRDERSRQGWQHGVENKIASALLYVEGHHSAIVRVIDPTPPPGGKWES